MGSAEQSGRHVRHCTVRQVTVVGSSCFIADPQEKWLADLVARLAEVAQQALPSVWTGTESLLHLSSIKVRLFKAAK